MERATSEPGGAYPRSRTTLALALVTPDVVQWATFGDSLVVAGDGASASLLARTRATYLGYSFARAEVSFLLKRGRQPRRRDDYVVLATDGLCDGRAASPGDLVGRVIRDRGDATSSARRIVSEALAAGAADAVTVVLAAPERDG